MPDSVPVRKRSRGSVTLDLERVTLREIALGDIGEPHPVIKARNDELQLNLSEAIDLRKLSPPALHFLMLSCPPLLLQRGGPKKPRFQLWAGGQLLSSLKKVLPLTTPIPVLVADTVLHAERLLQFAAARDAAVMMHASGLTQDIVRRLNENVEQHGRPPLIPDTLPGWRH